MVGGVGVRNHVIFDFVFAKIFFAARFETYFCHKDICTAVTDYYWVYVVLPCTISFKTYTSIKKFYSFITFTLLVNVIILLLNFLVFNTLSYIFPLLYNIFSCTFIYTVYSESLLTSVVFHLFYISRQSLLFPRTVRYSHVCYFYPTALKGCQDIVFTHGVWAGKGLSGLYLRNRKV